MKKVIIFFKNRLFNIRKKQAIKRALPLRSAKNCLKEVEGKFEVDAE